MTHVVMAVSTNVAGDARVLKSARSAAAAGFEVTVLADTNEVGDWQPPDGSFRVAAAAVDRSLPAPRRLRFRRPQPDADAMRLNGYTAAWKPLLDRLSPDLVHAHDSQGLAVIGATDAPVVYDAHEYLLGKTFKRQERADAYRAQFIALATRASAIVTVSEPLAAQLRRDLGLAADPVVVYNAPESSTPEWRGPPLGDRPVAVYSGTLTRYRRVDVLIDALAQLPGLQLALLVPPEHPRLAPLLEQARSLGVAERVHVAGFVPPADIVGRLATADVGLHPLERYANGDVAMPNKLFEYLHAGIRCVVSDTPAMAEFVTANNTGEAVALDDVDGWAHAIERALAAPRLDADPASWSALRAEWSWENQEQKLIAVYRSVLA